MSSVLTVHLNRPLQSVDLFYGTSDVNDVSMTDPAADSSPTHPDAAVLSAELQSQIQQYQLLCKTMQGVVSKVQTFYDELFAGSSEAIARLSIEIARKVLMRNIADGDYDIELIAKEMLKNAPASEDMVIRLNPQDLTDCRQIQQSEDGIFAGIELLEDPNISRGECILESPKGIVKSLIDEHLERIGNALAKTE